MLTTAPVRPHMLNTPDHGHKRQIAEGEKRNLPHVWHILYRSITMRTFKVLPMVPTVFANGTIGNSIGTNGTIGKNHWYHWENLEHRP